MRLIRTHKGILIPGPYLWTCDFSVPPWSGRLSSASRILTAAVAYRKDNGITNFFSKLPPFWCKPTYYCNPAALLCAFVFRPLPILLFFRVFSAPFLGRALLQGGISARNIRLFRADLLPLLLAKMCQLFLFLFCPLDFCSLCGFCSLCAPDTTFSAQCIALMAGRGFHSVHNFTVHVLGV